MTSLTPRASTAPTREAWGHSTSCSPRQHVLCAGEFVLSARGGLSPRDVGSPRVVAMPPNAVSQCGSLTPRDVGTPRSSHRGVVSSHRAVSPRMFFRQGRLAYLSAGYPSTLTTLSQQRLDATPRMPYRCSRAVLLSRRGADYYLYDQIFPEAHVYGGLRADSLPERPERKHRSRRLVHSERWR